MSVCLCISPQLGLIIMLLLLPCLFVCLSIVSLSASRRLAFMGYFFIFFRKIVLPLQALVSLSSLNPSLGDRSSSFHCQRLSRKTVLPSFSHIGLIEHVLRSKPIYFDDGCIHTLCRSALIICTFQRVFPSMPNFSEYLLWISACFASSLILCSICSNPSFSIVGIRTPDVCLSSCVSKETASVCVYTYVCLFLGLTAKLEYVTFLFVHLFLTSFFLNSFRLCQNIFLPNFLSPSAQVSIKKGNTEIRFEKSGVRGGDSNFQSSSYAVGT